MVETGPFLPYFFYAKAVIMLLASHQGIIVLSAEDEEFISHCLDDHELAGA